jgi:hypothetical protein
MSLDAATLVALAAALAGVLAYVAFGRGLAGKRAGAIVVLVLSLLSPRFDWRDKSLFFFPRLLRPLFSPPWLSVFPFSATWGPRPKVVLGPWWCGLEIERELACEWEGMAKES